MAAPHRAQRTLVKSRPELWAEVSDVEALCRHLGEFGEITITRLEPETTVAWEGTAARGTVELESSGWGTRVTLTAELVEAPEPPADGQPAADPAASHDEPTVAPAPGDVPAADAPPAEPVVEDVAAAAEDESPAAPVADHTPVPAEPLARVAEPDPEPAPSPAAIRAAERAAGRTAAATPPRKKPGFFARLFGRRSAPAAPPTPVAEPVAPAAPAAEDEKPETPAPPPPLRLVPRPDEDDDRPAPDATPQEDPDPPLVAEADAPAAMEVPEVAPEPARLIDGERAVAVLTATLDDLGAAHRRPFSNGV